MRFVLFDRGTHGLCENTTVEEEREGHISRAERRWLLRARISARSCLRRSISSGEGGSFHSSGSSMVAAACPGISGSSRTYSVAHERYHGRALLSTL